MSPYTITSSSVNKHHWFCLSSLYDFIKAYRTIFFSLLTPPSHTPTPWTNKERRLLPQILAVNAPGRMSGYTPPPPPHPYSLIWAAIEIKILYVLDEKLPSVVWSVYGEHVLLFNEFFPNTQFVGQYAT